MPRPAPRVAPATRATRPFSGARVEIFLAMPSRVCLAPLVPGRHAPLRDAFAPIGVGGLAVVVPGVVAAAAVVVLHRVTGPNDRFQAYESGLVTSEAFDCERHARA